VKELLAERNRIAEDISHDGHGATKRMICSGAIQPSGIFVRSDAELSEAALRIIVTETMKSARNYG